MAFDAGSVVVGIQVGGVTTFVQGWSAAVGAMSKATMEMAAFLGQQMEKVGEAAEKYAILSKQTDLSAGLISELAYAAKRSGTDIGALANGLNQAIRSGKMAAGNDGFRAVVEQLNALPDAASRAALAFDLFGRQGKDMIVVADAFRELSAEARQFGIAMTEADVGVAGRFNDSLERARSAIDGMWQQISLRLMPVVTVMLNAFAQALPILTEWIRRPGMIGEAFVWMVNQIQKAWRVLSDNRVVFAKFFSFLLDQAIELAAKLPRALVAGFEKGFEAIASVIRKIGAGLSLIPIDSAREMGSGLLSMASAMNVANVAATTLANAGIDQLKKEIGALSSPENIEMAIVKLDRFGAKVKELSFEMASAPMGALPTSNAEGSEPATPAKVAETDAELFNQAYGKMGNTMMRFVQQSAQAWQQYMKQGKGALSALGTAMLETAGSMAMGEGMYHFLAGLAMTFTPGLEAQGAHRMTNGALLMALGATLGLVGGGSKASGSSGGGTSGGGVDYSNTPGAEVEQPDKRRTLSVIVQGNLFNSRETWSHLAELSAEFSDSDIKFAQGSVATA